MLAEAQMMNTIEYRVDCQLLQHLHWDNNLGCRFPIGEAVHADTIKTRVESACCYDFSACMCTVMRRFQTLLSIQLAPLHIGKLEQVHEWESHMVRDFHARWYFPAGAYTRPLLSST